MREILFRGKRLNGSKGWVYGSLITGEIDTSIWSNDLVDDVDVDPATVGQYTGLTDKNGVRIFEGDVVRYIDPDTQEYDIGEKYVVGWDEDEACVLFECFVYGKSICYDVFNKRQGENLEVVGNTFDNPDLLKEASNGQTDHP